MTGIYVTGGPSKPELSVCFPAFVRAGLTDFSGARAVIIRCVSQKVKENCRSHARNAENVLSKRLEPTSSALKGIAVQTVP